MVNKIKEVLFLSVFIITILAMIYIAFVSAAVVMVSPTNGTNGQNFTKTNVRFNVTLINATDLITPVNATFYASPNGNGTWLVIGNTSATTGCGYDNPGGGANFSCTVLLNFSIADGNYTINATVYNQTTGIGINGTIGNVNMSKSVIFDSTPPAVSVVRPQTGWNISNNSGYVLNVSVIDATLGGISKVVFNVTTASSSTQINILNATNPGGGSYYNVSWNLTALDPGLYNITIYANDTLNNMNSTTVLVLLRLDALAPNSINFTAPVQGSNNTGTVKINISASDFNSSIGGVMFNITNRSNGLQNATIYASLETGSVWSASFSSATIYAGDYNITAYVNDTAGNQNSSRVLSQVIFDNTNPSGSFSCTPNPVDQEDTLTCSCSSSDASGGSGVKSTSYTASPATTSTGPFTQTCSITDYAGNNIELSASYTVQGTGSTGSSGGGGGGSSTSSPTTTISSGLSLKVSEAQVSSGYRANFYRDASIRIDIKPSGKAAVEQHTVTVSAIQTNTATVVVSSSPITLNLKTNETQKVDLDSDSTYDLSVKLNSIASNKADLTVKKISEAIIKPGQGNITGQQPPASGSGIPTENKGTNKAVLWIFLVVLVIGAGLIIWFIVRKNMK